MNRFILKKLTFFGKKDGRSLSPSITFGNHFTFVEGPSDTGKSLLYESLDYLLARNNKPKEKKGKQGEKVEPHLPFDGRFPGGVVYNKLSLDIQFGDSLYTFDRDFNGKKTLVTPYYSAEDGLENYSSAKMDALLLRKLGIQPGIQIPKNVSGDTQALTWRTIQNYFLFSQDDIARTKSILLPTQDIFGTATLSSLLYLLYKTDFSKYNQNENNKLREQAKAISNYLSKKNEENLAKKTDLEAKLKENGIDTNDLGKLSSILQQMKDNLKKATDDFNSGIATVNTLNEEIAKFQEKQASYALTLDGCNRLQSQYSKDIERLTFIVKSGAAISKYGSVRKCSYCGHDYLVDQQGSQEELIASSQKELEKTIQNLNQLLSEIEFLKTQIAKNDECLKAKAQQKDQISDHLSKDILPIKETFELSVSQIKDYIDLKSQLDSIDLQSKAIETDKSKYDPESIPQIEYHPTDLFHGDFPEKISKIFSQIMLEMNYGFSEEFKFDVGSFNIDSFGGEVGYHHGEGYRGLLNAVLALSLYKYFQENKSSTSPNLLILDSPLKSLSLPESEKGQEQNLRLRFFQTVAKEAGDGQIVLLDNAHEAELAGIPNDGKDSTIITFTQKEEGRYGLLDEVRYLKKANPK
jgi:hypothetical protein